MYRYPKSTASIKLIKLKPTWAHLSEHRFRSVCRLLKHQGGIPAFRKRPSHPRSPYRSSPQGPSLLQLQSGCCRQRAGWSLPHYPSRRWKLIPFRLSLAIFKLMVMKTLSRYLSTVVVLSHLSPFWVGLNPPKLGLMYLFQS